MNKGIMYAAGAYLLWGVFPVFWKLLQELPASELLGHRMAWSLVLLMFLSTYRRNWRWLSVALRNRTVVLTYLGTACLLAINWFVYIWAVNSEQIVETSLGYFINPLVNVLLGVVFLKERMRPWQWVAVIMAAAGVGWLTLAYGALPWIALTLAFTFGLYGLLRKTAALNSLEGLTLEMGALFLPAAGYLLFLEFTGVGSFGHSGPATTALLMLSGFVTAVPLLLFAAGARRIKLVTLGLLQYVAPTMQLLLGVLVYAEPFPAERMAGFGLIWFALLAYSIEGVMVSRRQTKIRYAS